jgi:hypothetical protein
MKALVVLESIAVGMSGAVFECVPAIDCADGTSAAACAAAWAVMAAGSLAETLMG